MEHEVLPQNKSSNRNVFFVGLLSFFGGISQDIFTPILPTYYTTILGFDKTFVGIADPDQGICLLRGAVAQGENGSRVYASGSRQEDRQAAITYLEYRIRTATR